MGNSVLYIEDNPDNMMLVRRALESRGYKLLQALTGIEGVSKAENEEVDLILLDINLPDIDGYEVTQKKHSPQAAMCTCPNRSTFASYGRAWRHLSLHPIQNKYLQVVTCENILSYRSDLFGLWKIFFHQ